MYAVLSWVHRQLKKPGYWWRKRVFTKGGWAPTLNQIGAAVEEVLVSDVLDPIPDVIISGEQKGGRARRYGKKFTFYVSEEELKLKQLRDESLVSLTEHVVIARTAPFRPYLPPEIRQAVDEITSESVAWSVRPEAVDLLAGQEAFDGQDGEMPSRDKVEQMLLAGEMIPFLRKVLTDHKGEAPTSRVHKQVRESFERRFKSLQESFRGFLVRLSRVRADFYRQGLLSVLVPARVTAPTTYHDWHLFVWVNPDGVLGRAEVTGVVSGEFEELWSTYGPSHYAIRGMSSEQVYEAVSGWARGLGGKRGKRQKSVVKGEALRLNQVMITSLVWFDNPISKAEFKALTQGRLTDFGNLTQKQVVSLIERGP